MFCLMVKCIVRNYQIIIIELKIKINCLLIVFVVAAAVAANDDVLFSSFCFCLLLLLLFVCLYVLFFSLFAKLVLFRFLAWFSIIISNMLTLYTSNFLLYISPRLYKHFLLYPSKPQCHFFICLKVGGGQTRKPSLLEGCPILTNRLRWC